MTRKITNGIPADILAQHVIALGKTGSGKSSKLRILVEYLLDQGLPVCLLDPKGDWWGLKLSADGKRAGYPVVIFGGEHADIPINEHAGKQVAEIVATGNRPCIIDMGEMLVRERTRFFIDFAATLFRRSKGSRHLVIDEAHNFAPKGQQLRGDTPMMLHWANRLASEGRGKNIKIIAASQRSQKVHNDFLTSCETLIAGRVIHAADRRAIKEWVDGADPEAGKALLSELADMKRTEAYVWSPENGFGPARVKFPMFKTYDSFKPQTENEMGALKGWAELDLDEIRDKFKGLIEEEKSNDPAELKKRVRDLERELRGHRDCVSAKACALQVAKARREGADNASVSPTPAMVDTGLQAALREIHAITARHMPGDLAARYPGSATAPQRKPAPTPRPALNGKMPPTVRKIIDVIHRSCPVALTFEAAAARAGVSRRSSAYRSYKKAVLESEEIEARESDGRLQSAEGFKASVPEGADPIEEFSRKLPPSYAKMLKVIAESSLSMYAEEVAVSAGVSPTSSGLSAGLRELQELGLIEKSGSQYALHPDLK